MHGSTNPEAFWQKANAFLYPFIFVNAKWLAFNYLINLSQSTILHHNLPTLFYNLLIKTAFPSVFFSWISIWLMVTIHYGDDLALAHYIYMHNRISLTRIHSHSYLFVFNNLSRLCSLNDGFIYALKQRSAIHTLSICGLTFTE